MFRAYKYHPSAVGYRHASHGCGASSERFNNDLGQLTDVTEIRMVHTQIMGQLGI